MSEHPIKSLMTTAMENLKDMIDVNTIIGDPVETPDGSVILTVSKVGFGFAAGGSEFHGGGSSGPDKHDGGGGNQQNQVKSYLLAEVVGAGFPSHQSLSLSLVRQV
jgi:sporulation protein YtfJ